MSLFLLSQCKTEKKEALPTIQSTKQQAILYAKGFTMEKSSLGITVITITSPWPNSEKIFKYALVPQEKLATISLNKDDYDAIVVTPVKRIIVTSTTHIPALEALEVEHTLVGFPSTNYISSKKTRALVDANKVKELGANETLNTEMVIEMNPGVVVGFGIDNKNNAYEALQNSNIAVVYNGDWTEEHPLGKAEWIKFFAALFQLEQKADSIFDEIKNSYEDTKALAQKATTKSTVLSGAMYKDVWYLPGGRSWAAQFLKDANVQYLWDQTQETGSLSLSIESVLENGQQADFWISPSQFTSYTALKKENAVYQEFKAFKNKNIYTFANTKGETGGLLYFELAPNRPDLVLKDLLHIFHPELLPNYSPYFFKPMQE